MATHLEEAYGCDLKSGEGSMKWSTKILDSQPEIVQAVHRDFFEAGA